MSGQLTLEPAAAPPPPRRARRRPGRRTLLLGALSGIVLVAGGLGLMRGLTSSDSPPVTSVAPAAVAPQWHRPTVTATTLARSSGVRITRVAVTGGGGLVDLRFQVVDPAKAHALHDPSTPPAVVDQQSGLVVHDLLMNHSHTGEYHAGATYYLIFNNPGNWVHRGGTVTVLLGNAAVPNVVVK